MKLSQNKKAASTELIFLFSLFGIVLILSVFYVWVQKNITDQTKTQAESIAADVERRIFFSTLIHEHGLDLANKNEDDVETIIEDYAKKQAAIEKGDYDASCSTEGNDRNCKLTITAHDILSKIWVASFFNVGVNFLTIPAYVLMKALSLDLLSETKTAAYLPAKGKAMRFTLDVKVVFA